MKNKLSLLLLVIFPFISSAQSDDLQLWSSVKFSKKVNAKIRMELQEQIRWEDNMSQYKKSFTDLGFRYKVLKSHSLGMNIRIVNEFNEDKYMRMNLDGNSEYSLKTMPITIKQRVRFQQSWDSIGERDKSLFRTKWTLALKGKLISPYISHELYWKLATQNEHSKKRYTLGINWNMLNRLKMKLFFRSQQEFNKKNPEQIQVIGFGANYKI